MNATLTRTHQQPSRVQFHTTAMDTFAAFNLLTSDVLFDELERLSPEHRERLFTPTETLSMFIAQGLSADRSCQNVVNQSAIKRITSGLPGCRSHTGAYCRARQRLPTAMVSGLTRYLGACIDSQSPENWLWKSRRVCLVDGTTMTMPDTPENQGRFPQQGAQKPGLGFPICRFVGITCLSTGAILEGAVGRFNGKGANEQALLRDILHVFQPGDIVLGDAFYPTWFFLADMQARNVDILMEQQGARRRSTDFRQGRKLGERDHMICMEKPKIKPAWLTQDGYDKAPDRLFVREFKAGGKIMVTTLTNPKPALKALYQRRWDIELNLRDIKETMGMNILSCKTPEMVLKEVWVYLLAYNLIRLLMCQSALLADIAPRQISFKHCLQVALIWAQKSTLLDDKMQMSLLLLMSQQRVGKRPGRIEPRAVKRRPKPYPLLMKTRAQARMEVQTNGHPKKLK